MFYFDRPFRVSSGFLFIFDRIGVRHSGIGASASSCICLEQVGSSVFSRNFWFAVFSTVHGVFRGCVVDFASSLIIGMGYTQAT